jgi:hypothetical protein
MHVEHEYFRCGAWTYSVLSVSLRKGVGSTYFWEESPARIRRTEVRPT